MDAISLAIIAILLATGATQFKKKPTEKELEARNEAVLQITEENIGKECIVYSKNLQHGFVSDTKIISRKMRGVIKEVDDKWIEIQVKKRNKEYIILLKIDDIRKIEIVL